MDKLEQRGGVGNLVRARTLLHAARVWLRGEIHTGRKRHRIRRAAQLEQVELHLEQLAERVGLPVAELERAAHARAVAAAKGKQPGRPRKLTVAKLATAKAAIAGGQSVDEAAQALGISRATLYRHLAADGGQQQQQSNR